MDANELEGIERPRKGRSLPEILTKQEVRSLLLACINAKHRCLLSLLYGCGLRIGEALAMRLGDVRSAEGLLYVRSGKGKKDRRVPLSKTNLWQLRVYYEKYKPQHYLFEGKPG